MKVTADAARRFLVARHFLAPPRSLAGGPDAVLEVFRRLGSIQFDPIAVAGRSHDLVLHARVAGYEPAWCDALYERRAIFEATNKRRGGRARAGAHPDGGAAVVGRLRAGGRCDEGLVRDAGERRSLGARGLHGHRRARARTPRRQPALLRPPRTAAPGRRARPRGAGARAGPAQAPVPVPRPRAARRRRSRRHLRAPGRPTGAQRASRRARRPGLARAGGRRGRARPALRPRRGARAAAGAPEPAPSVAFISPFDSLLWDTALLAGLFGFDFVWEGFFPQAKRRWGYYVLPILFGDRFVGRIEPRIDREGARAEVLGLWWEDGFAPRRADGFVDAMRDALRAYLRFAGADRLEWAGHLATEKRLFLDRP